MSIPEDQQRNYELFRDCLAAALIEKISEPSNKPRRRTRTKKSKKATTSSLSRSDKSVNESKSGVQSINNETSSPKVDEAGDDKGRSGNDTNGPDADAVHSDEGGNQDDLAEFTDYIASETFASLPEELKSVDYHDFAASSSLQARYVPPFTGADIPRLLPLLDPGIADSLAAYGITNESTQGIDELLAPVMTGFVEALATPPPPPKSTRASVDACEICRRGWVSLTYHHLIPRFVHAKAVKRGWHRECDLQNVAWLCGSCHGFVHRFASNEDLARHFYTVERLLAEDEVGKWALYAGKLRWKGK